MIARLPIVPTLLVAIAVAIMIGLGVWQLDRAEQKDALLERYASAQDKPPIAWPSIPTAGTDRPLFRRATGYCLQPVTRRATAGRNRLGEPGYVHIVRCRTGAEGPGMPVEIGWSRDPRTPIRWGGGAVSGIIAPDRGGGIKLVADRSPAGLQPAAPPSPQSIPDNHLGYALTWFAFALTALIIYLLALRKRIAGEASK